MDYKRWEVKKKTQIAKSIKKEELEILRRESETKKL